MMGCKICYDTSGLARSEKRRLRDLLYIIHSVVRRHGGIVELDPTTKSVDISVPQGKETVCAQEIDKWMGAIFC